MNILVPKPLVRTKRGLVAPEEAFGRPKGKPAGSYVDDLVALGKAIVLCLTCRHRFDFKKARYRVPDWGRHVIGRCDGCRFDGANRLYLAESDYKTTWR